MKNLIKEYKKRKAEYWQNQYWQNRGICLEFLPKDFQNEVLTSKECLLPKQFYPEKETESELK